jgi:bifunctional DNase/RNase
MPSEKPTSATTAADSDGHLADTTVTADAAFGPPEPDDATGTMSPSDTAPSDTAPSDTAPSDTAPSDTAPSDTAPVEGTATAPETPDEVTGEEATLQEAPTKPADLWAVVMVFDIAVDLPTPYARVTLREVSEPNRMLVIPIGLPEGTALAHAWRGVPTPRPLTHELFADVLTRLGATIDVVRLIGRTAGIVLAEIELSSARGREVVPCRPTDALTLSVRQGVPAPILVDLRLFDEEGDVDPDG